MHTLQKLLIKRLVEENGRSFASLTQGYDSEDNIVFHLKQLISNDLIEKRDSIYFVTAKGINKLNEFQKTDLQDNSFKMFFAGFICACNNEYLLRRHPNASEPFYNLPSGSPLFGEALKDALPRIFYYETGINVPFETFTFDSIHLKTVNTKEGITLFDDSFAVYKINVDEDEKEKMTLRKECVWMNIEAITKLPNKWQEIDFCILRNNWEVYKNYTIVSDYVLRR